MDNLSNQLKDRLNFKSLLIPSWFGIRSEDWIRVMDSIEKVICETMAKEVIQKLLEIENSPEYWMDCVSWPHPDQKYLKGLAYLIDLEAPEDWPIEMKTFVFAYTLQQMRMIAPKLLMEVYKINQQKQ